MSKLDKIISVAFITLSIIDLLIYIFWIPDFHWQLLLIPINIFNLMVFLKKPEGIREPYKLVSGWFLIFTISKILTLGNSWIWILEYSLSGLAGIIALIAHVKYERNTS